MDLSLVPIEELSEELMKRGDCGITLITGIGSDGNAYINWTGDYYKALGLCVDMQRFIIEDSHEDY